MSTPADRPLSVSSSEPTAAGFGQYLQLVSRRVRAYRILTGLRQEELADRAGVSRVTLGSLERGDHGAGVLTYLKVSQALAVSMGALLDEEVR